MFGPDWLIISNFRLRRSDNLHKTLTKAATLKNTMILFVCPSKLLHKHCFRFLLGLTVVPRENKILVQNLGRANKEYYGIFESGLLQFVAKTCVDTSLFVAIV